MIGDAVRDDRKSATLAGRHVAAPKGARSVGRFDLARDVLRSHDMCQAGVGADQRVIGDPRFTPVFFLDGEEHKLRRQAIARFFTPKAISTRYRVTMEQTSDRLVAGLRSRGRGQLDDIAFELTVGVAAEIVGLTNSDPAAMARRISAVLITTRTPDMPRWLRPAGSALAAAAAMRFFVQDVRPAIAARKRQRRTDVISHLLDEGYPNKAILIECMTYAVAGMVTTREFIVMAAWHMFDNPELHRRFVGSDEAGQLAILEEILRLEPVAAIIHRRSGADVDFESGHVAAGERLAVMIRDANVDEEVVGECPFALDPDRGTRSRVVGAYLSFGEGSHRCPGSQVALNESRVFLDRLMRVPGLKLVRRPDMTWNQGIMSYELRRAILTCERE
jgi:cytochrome P450